MWPSLWLLVFAGTSVLSTPVPHVKATTPKFGEFSVKENTPEAPRHPFPPPLATSPKVVTLEESQSTFDTPSYGPDGIPTSSTLHPTHTSPHSTLSSPSSSSPGPSKPSPSRLFPYEEANRRGTTIPGFHPVDAISDRITRSGSELLDDVIASDNQELGPVYLLEGFIRPMRL